MDYNLQKQLDEIKRYSLLAAKNVLTVDDACLLTGYKRNTILKMVSEHAIPYYKPRGKEIFFKKSEIEDYLLSQDGRIPTISELINV